MTTPTPTPGEVLFALQALLHSLAQEDGRIPQITGIYGIDCEGDKVYIHYDISTGGDPLMFEFERPASVSVSDIPEFGRWLACGMGAPIH